MHYLGWLHLIFGLWLLTSPLTFGYTNQAMILNSYVCGALALIFGTISIRKPLFLWVIALIGIWLQLVPLIFWAPHPTAYLNDSVMGALLIIFSIVVEGTPGTPDSLGPQIPHGWSYNPSAYFQRVPVIGLNFMCWFIARYLAAYQLGYIDTVWDPFFGEGTEKVLTSTVSKMFPVSDAGLGAVAYTLEAITGFGGPRRWHTSPWLVLFFGFLAVPVGCVSILLIILQPTVVGHFCSLCIFTAVLMLITIPLAVDEVVAVVQFLHRSVKEGKPFWRTLFRGISLPEGDADRRSATFRQPISKGIQTMLFGISIPWNLFLLTLCGIAALVWGDFIPSALIIVFSVIAYAEVTRAVRWICIPMGVWLCFSCLPLGLAAIALAWRKGHIQETYASWDQWIV